MCTDVVQKRIDRIKYLISRLDYIPRELDEINERLFSGFLSRKTFVELVNRRSNLLVEQENRDRELREVYRILEMEEEF